MGRNVVRKYKYSIGDRFKDNERDIEIIDRKMEFENALSHGKRVPICVKWYRIKCHICGWDEHWARQDRIEHKIKYRCACCNNKIVVPGFNDIATTHPQKIKYFVNIEDTTKYSHASHQKTYTKCPDCGDVRLRVIREVIEEYKYSCAKCGDGFSLPEKFMYNILRSCGVEFIHQLSKKHFEWCNQFLYDFYIPKANMIIEVNGMQHYNNKFYTTVNEQFVNDVVKIKLAQTNGIRNYEIIHALDSSYDYLAKVISEHKLFEKLGININEIDLKKCYENSCSSLLKIVCDDYNNNSNQLIIDLAKKYNIGRQTVRKYLKRGTAIGLCNYDFKKQLHISNKLRWERRKSYENDGSEKRKS